MTTAKEKHGLRVRGLNLATKLALAVAGVVAVFMIVFGFAIGRSLESAVKTQVMAAAAEAARAASRADLHAWTRHFGTPWQGMSEQQVAEARAGFGVFETNQYDRLEPVRDWNTSRFARLVDETSHVLAADLISVDPVTEERRLLAASYEGSLEFTPVLGSPMRRFGDATAREGLLQTDGRQAHVIRGTAPVMDRERGKLAEFSIYLEAVAIREATAAFDLEIAYAAAVFVVLGGGLAFWLGRTIARPIRHLQEDIRVVASGDFEHHTRVLSHDEIGELAVTFDSMTKSLAEAREAERRAQRSQQEIALAGEVVALHQTALPELPGYDGAGLHARKPVPGDDYYDVLALPDGRHAWMVASASGTGLPAAMVLAMARSFLRAVLEHESDPAAALRKVNALIGGDLKKGMYVSVLLAVLDPADGMVRLANAGHTPLHHWHADEGRLFTLHSEGIALGFDSGPVFDQTLKPVELQLCKGDRIFLHGTDLANIPGTDGQPLGEARLQKLLAHEAPRGADDVIAHARAVLRKFTGQDDPHVTLLTLGRPGR